MAHCGNRLQPSLDSRAPRGPASGGNGNGATHHNAPGPVALAPSCLLCWRYLALRAPHPPSARVPDGSGCCACWWRPWIPNHTTIVTCHHAFSEKCWLMIEVIVNDDYWLTIMQHGYLGQNKENERGQAESIISTTMVHHGSPTPANARHKPPNYMILQVIHRSYTARQSTTMSIQPTIHQSFQHLSRLQGDGVAPVTAQAPRSSFLMVHFCERRLARIHVVRNRHPGASPYLSLQSLEIP